MVYKIPGYQALLNPTLPMKTIFLIAFVSCLFPGVTKAQIDKGTIYAGVTTNLNYTSTDFDLDDNLNSLNINLNGGYFLASNFLAGGTFGYSASGFGDLDNTATTLGIFLRNYLNGAVFFGLGYESFNPDEGSTLERIPVEAGYAAFLNDHVAIEPSITYSFGIGDIDANAISINIGFGIYFR